MAKMSKKNNLDHLAWLCANKSYIKIRQLEIELDMPEGTLKKFVDGRRELPENWHKVVIDKVKKLKDCGR